MSYWELYKNSTVSHVISVCLLMSQDVMGAVWNTNKVISTFVMEQESIIYTDRNLIESLHITFNI